MMEMTDEIERPSVFIASTSESMEVANHVKKYLSASCYPVVWSEHFSAHGLGEPTLQTLLFAASEYHFSLVVFGGEDKTISKKKTMLSARDNVIYEAGLFHGRYLEAGRVFIIARENQKKNLKFPSDIKDLHVSFWGKTSLRDRCVAISKKIKSKFEQLASAHVKVGASYDMGKETFFRRKLSLTLTASETAVISDARIFLEGAGKDLVVHPNILRNPVNSFVVPLFMPAIQIERGHRRVADIQETVSVLHSKTPTTFYLPLAFEGKVNDGWERHLLIENGEGIGTFEFTETRLKGGARSIRRRMRI